MVSKQSMLLALLAASSVVILAPRTEASVYEEKPNVPITVCLDPGHPSENGSGARGQRVTEQAMVWEIAVLTTRLLERSGIRVVLTKTREDEYVTNRRRAEIANIANADLMLRLHMDAAPVRGFAAYYPSRQGVVNGYRGPSRQVIEDSGLAAKAFFDAVVPQLEGVLPIRGLYTDLQTKIGKEQGALTGSIYSEVPAILVEICTITNEEDERVVETSEGRLAIAHALHEGVVSALISLSRE